MRATHLFFFFCLLLPSVLGFIDLKISASDMAFSNANPAEGENITINVTIRNLGNESANNVLVEFWDDAINIGNSTIDFLPFSSTSVIRFWNAEIGPSNITVRVDPKNIFLESNETNNNATQKVSISAYHTYVGTVRSFTALGIGSDFLFGTETSGCNLLVTDSDSTVDFSALKALGRRKIFGVGLNDFIDADVLLNMTFFDDSISAEWTSFDNSPSPFFKIFPQETRPFLVFNKTILDVPIVNSTNSTFFRTGILWDASDDTDGSNGQFDINDKEDLIFVANINQSKSGKFGVYDYEIKIPALLREYKPGSSTVDFFIDLDSFPCS